MVSNGVTGIILWFYRPGLLTFGLSETIGLVKVPRFFCGMSG